MRRNGIAAAAFSVGGFTACKASAVWVTSAIPTIIHGVAVLSIVHVRGGWLEVAIGVVIGVLGGLEVGRSVSEASKGG